LYFAFKYIIVDAEKFPFLDDQFDIVTCRIATHHFPHPEAFVHEAYLVLKPGGKFLFIDNIAPENDRFDTFVNHLEKIRDYTHDRSYKISEWKNHFNKRGFTWIRETSRKKTLPFKEWSERTLHDAKDISDVEQTLLDAPNDIQQYFQLKKDTSTILSFAIDEWMVLYEK